MKWRSILVLTTVSISIIISSIGFAQTETLQVSSTTGVPIQTSSTLELGQPYLIEVSGTYTYSSGGRIADAEFAYHADLHTWQEEPQYNPLLLDLLVNETQQDWLGSADGVNFSPHTYSPDHVYRLKFIGQGLPISFVIYDTSYDWNEGYLTVSISPVFEYAPDLVAKCKSFHSTDFGKKINVTANITNNGIEDADAFTIAMYLSDNGIDLEEPPLDDRYVRKGLRVDKSRNKRLRYISEESLSGKYVVIIVDSDEVVDEISEYNNNIIIQIP